MTESICDYTKNGETPIDCIKRNRKDAETALSLFEESFDQRVKFRSALEEIREIYAGMEGFTPETAPEGYLQQVIEQMWDVVKGVLSS